VGLHSPLGWAAVHPGDFEAVLALRIRALRPGLERLGRFSPERARERLAADFVPQHARHVLWDGERVGYLNLQPEGEDALRLVHLYLDPAAQGRGIGSTAMRWVLQQADVAQRSLHVTALQGSRAVAFYLRHGFAEVAQDALDVHLVRGPQRHPLSVVLDLWARVQARDWAGLHALLHPELLARWWSSGELFSGPEAFVRVQSTYPEGWTIHLLQVSATDDGRVMAIVRVDHPPLRFFATSLCALRDARVVSVDETWATLEEPPAWRLQAGIPQWQRFDPAAPR
jgi:GNAT superfamily N-acetyltransferase